jgi:hypothetical protein
LLASSIAAIKSPTLKPKLIVMFSWLKLKIEGSVVKEHHRYAQRRKMKLKLAEPRDALVNDALAPDHAP